MAGGLDRLVARLRRALRRRCTRSASRRRAGGRLGGAAADLQAAGNAGYASITESALTGYGGLALRADGQRGYAARLGHEEPVSYPYRLRYKPEDIERLAKPATIDRHDHVALARRHRWRGR